MGRTTGQAGTACWFGRWSMSSCKRRTPHPIPASAAVLDNVRLFRRTGCLLLCVCSCSTPLMRERQTREVYCVACDLPVRVERQAAASAAAAVSSTGHDAQAAAADAATAQQQQQQQGEHRHAPAAGVAVGCTAAPAAVSFGAGAGSLAHAAGVGQQSQGNDELFSKQEVSCLPQVQKTSTTLVRAGLQGAMPVCAQLCSPPSAARSDVVSACAMWWFGYS